MDRVREQADVLDIRMSRPVDYDRIDNASGPNARATYWLSGWPGTRTQSIRLAPALCHYPCVKRVSVIARVLADTGGHQVYPVPYIGKRTPTTMAVPVPVPVHSARSSARASASHTARTAL